jgi:hypothetical protein
MLNLIICGIVGHKKWQWDSVHPIMDFTQAPSLGKDRLWFDCCSRCKLLYARVVPYDYKYPEQVIPGVVGESVNGQ